MSTNVSIETEMTQSPSPMEVKTNWKTETPVPDGHLPTAVTEGLLEQIQFMVESFEKQGIPKEETSKRLFDALWHQLYDSIYFFHIFEALTMNPTENYKYGEVERPSYLEISPDIYNYIPLEAHSHLEQSLDAVAKVLNHFTLLGAEFESVQIFMEKDDSDGYQLRISTDIIHKTHKVVFR